ncbi:hypothetical protein BDW62DRAFT_200624 [Aspergillus aurantiobrunneus]
MLSNLPPEILLLIAGHLPSYRDTLRLASCCHQIHRLLAPHAYTTLTLDNSGLRHLSRLVHTLARNPQLAKAVRALRFTDSSCSHPPHTLYYDRGTIQPFIESIASSSDELVTWEKDLKAGIDTDPWVTLLLLLVPNLEELGLTFEYPSAYLRKTIQRVTQDSGNLTLGRLKEVTFGWWDTEGGLPSSYVRPFFRLPSLRRFTGHMLRDGYTEDDDECSDSYEDEEAEGEARVARYPLDEHFSNITHLHLHYSNSANGLPDLISAPKRLVSFAYEHSGQNGDLDPINPAAFYSSLRKHKESLEEITVCEDTWSYSVADPLDAQFVGSFTDFTALKRLRLRGQNILDWKDTKGAGARNTLSDVLPVSLESLTIEAFDECDNANLTIYLETFVRNVKSHCPNLVVLEIKGRMREKDPSTTNWNYTWPRPVPGITPSYLEMTGYVASLCREANIRFQLRDPIIEHIVEQNAASVAFQAERERDEL